MKLWVDFELSITLKTLNEKNGWMNHDNRKKLKKNQIVHTIWLRFFRPFVPMNILSGWFLSVSLFVCVFFLYVFVFVCLCVFALSLRFLNRTNVRKIFLGTRFLSVSLFVYLSLFIYLSVFYSYAVFLYVSHFV